MVKAAFLGGTPSQPPLRASTKAVVTKCCDQQAGYGKLAMFFNNAPIKRLNEFVGAASLVGFLGVFANNVFSSFSVEAPH